MSPRCLLLCISHRPTVEVVESDAVKGDVDDWSGGDTVVPNLSDASLAAGKQINRIIFVCHGFFPLCALYTRRHTPLVCLGFGTAPLIVQEELNRSGGLWGTAFGGKR